jgi:hypothetical protein
MKISDSARNAAVNAVAALIDGGSAHGNLYIRTGAAPTNTTDADSGTLLSTLPMSDPAFGSAAGGTATANAITSDTNIAATGTAGHFRGKDSNGVTVLQGSCGTSGADINFDSVSFIAGGTCAISSLTLTQPAS